MAEPFGIVTGALSVTALFNNCVACFEFIQLGRQLGRDFQACQLRLDTARARLGRWGEAANVHTDPRFAMASASTDKSVQHVKDTLEEITELFEAAQKTSKRYELREAPDALVLFEADDMDPIGRRLHDRSMSLARRRQRGASLVKKTTWALYDGKQLEKLVSQITTLVDDLEKLFPVEAICRRLAEVEIEEIEDEPSLAALQEAARGVDDVLLGAVDQKLNEIAGRNSARDIRAEERADVQVGHRYTNAVLAQGIVVTDRAINSAGNIAASGDSNVHIGSRFGS